jgi:hypothetical protein
MHPHKSNSGVPLALAVPGTSAPIDNPGLAQRISEFAVAAGAASDAALATLSVAQLFKGPGWVNDQGVACIVMLAIDDKPLRNIRRAGEALFIAWLWNNAPSLYFSLTVGVRGGTPRPHARWMCNADDPVVAAIRREGRFLISVATLQGQHTGWMDASFHRGDGAGSTLPELEGLWAFPRPGIPYSNLHERFDPMRRKPFNEEHADEIAMWQEPVGDFWETLHYDGPWSADLTPKDRARAAWGRMAYTRRSQAAGFIRVIVERQVIDGEAPLVDEYGTWMQEDALQERAQMLVGRAPALGGWLAAIAGPRPDAQAAHAAAFQLLNTPYALFCMADKFIPLMNEADDEVFLMALHSSFEAALLDPRVTLEGARRPWLANATEGYGLELRTAPFDLEAPLKDIERTWLSGLEIDQMVELGRRIGAHDFMAPLDIVCKAFDSLSLQATIDDAEAKIQALLLEAQEARQWSIPWGARVEITFGPFVAVRIFEQDGEFSCHFLDDQDRYFLVSVGLQRRPPVASSSRLMRHYDDQAHATWNDDAEVSLKLIAAAIVRDFIVVEDREAVFSARPMRRRIRGHDMRTVIYLPRVRYSTPHPERMLLEKGLDAAAGRARHPVGPHLRKSAHASTTQRFLAQRYGMHLPEGFTFVKPHERGGAREEERIRIYRSRSASRMIFDEVDRAPAGTRPSWFDFEKDCARLLARRGMRVIHQAANRDGDGGVDLFAVEGGPGAGNNGEAGTGEEVSWVVQCKCWALHRPVGPEVVRELVGAIAKADRGRAANSRGMIITTSRLTPGALAEAQAHGFEVLQGEELATAFR